MFCTGNEYGTTEMKRVSERNLSSTLNIHSIFLFYIVAFEGFVVFFLAGVGAYDTGTVICLVEGT